jgi:hypothetical protein
MPDIARLRIIIVLYHLEYFKFKWPSALIAIRIEKFYSYVVTLTILCLPIC